MDVRGFKEAADQLTKIVKTYNWHLVIQARGTTGHGRIRTVFLSRRNSRN
jgi:hypothetical protein